MFKFPRETESLTTFNTSLPAFSTTCNSTVAWHKLQINMIHQWVLPTTTTATTTATTIATTTHRICACAKVCRAVIRDVRPVILAVVPIKRSFHSEPVAGVATEKKQHQQLQPPAKTTTVTCTFYFASTLLTG